MSGLPLGWDVGASRPDHAFGFSHAPRGGPSAAPTLVEDDTEAHAFVCGAAGSGKGRAFAVPALLSWPGSVVAVDIKGELFNVTGRHRASLGPVVVIDPFLEVSDGSGAFNPLSGLASDAPTFIDDIYALASLFVDDRAFSGKDGKFWEQSGADVIAGVAAHVASSVEETDRSFGRVYELTHSADDPIYNLAVLCDAKVKLPFSLTKLGAFLSLPDITRGGVKVTYENQMRLLASPCVRASLAGDTIARSDIRAGAPFTIFLVWPPDKVRSHAALLRLFLTGITAELMKRRRPPRRKTLMLIDEAAQIGAMPSLVSATTLGRGYGIRIAWVFQSYSQMEKVYPEDCDAIVENCGVAITFGRHPSFCMSRTLSDQVFGDVPASALFALGEDEAFVRCAGGPSRRIRKLDYLNDAMFAGRFDPNPLHEPLSAAAAAT